jgi:hypothetical protein
MWQAACRYATYTRDILESPECPSTMCRAGWAYARRPSGTVRPVARSVRSLSRAEQRPGPRHQPQCRKQISEPATQLNRIRVEKIQAEIIQICWKTIAHRADLLDKLDERRERGSDFPFQLGERSILIHRDINRANVASTGFPDRVNEVIHVRRIEQHRLPGTWVSGFWGCYVPAIRTL